MVDNLKVSKYTQDVFDVSIIIVNYNAGKYLEETINSVYQNTKDLSYEIIVVDNDSKKDEESYLYLKNTLVNNLNTTVYFSDENLGFAKANNYGMKIAKGRNILLLNPDIILHNNAIKYLSDYLDTNSKTGIIGPKVLNVDGSFQHTCLRGKPYPKDTLFHIIGLAKTFSNCEYFNGFALNNRNIDEINECNSVSGCCLMIKQSVYKQVGGMDETFFMYQEETDWCLRVFESGYNIIYNPNAVVTHYQGITTKKVKLKSVYIFTQSMEKFFKKHFWSKYNIIQKCFWLFLIWGNFVLKSLKGMFK